MPQKGVRCEQDERVAVLVLRAWIEPGRDPCFRARLTSIGDLEGSQTELVEVVVTPSAKKTVTTIEDWLQRFICRGSA
jgi:hypothetical protein